MTVRSSAFRRLLASKPTPPPIKAVLRTLTPTTHYSLPTPPVRIFIAGIMQGSHRESVLHEQDYRARLKDLLRKYIPGADIYDPLDDHRESLAYDDAKGRRVSTPVDAWREPGRYEVQVNATPKLDPPLAPGVYFARLDLAGVRLAAKVVVVR